MEVNKKNYQWKSPLIKHSLEKEYNKEKKFIISSKSHKDIFVGSQAVKLNVRNQKENIESLKTLNKK